MSAGVGRVLLAVADEAAAHVRHATRFAARRPTHAPPRDTSRLVVFVHGFLGHPRLLEPMATRVRDALGVSVAATFAP